MIDFLIKLFSYEFILRAIAVGTLVSLCASLLGVTLVLKRYSMIGDGLSHVGFGALAVAMALGFAPLLVAIPVVMLAAFLLLRVSNNGRINGDALIALVSGSSLAIGVTAVSISGVSADISSYMFGSILAVSANDLFISAGAAIVVLIVYMVFYNRIFSITFDEDFARATGKRAGLYNTVVALLTALVVTVGMRLMGAMLISSLIMFPALSSMKLFGSYRRVIISSALISVLCFIIGIMISFAFSTPAGASVVIVNLIVFCAASAVKTLFP